MQKRGSDLSDRTKAFAMRVLCFVRALPGTVSGQVLGRQLLRAASAVGANYRAARCSRSRREFQARLGVVAEETDETVYWLELLAHDPECGRSGVADLLAEARELRAIFAAALRTARSR